MTYTNENQPEGKSEKFSERWEVSSHATHTIARTLLLKQQDEYSIKLSCLDVISESDRHDASIVVYDAIQENADRRAARIASIPDMLKALERAEGVLKEAQRRLPMSPSFDGLAQRISNVRGEIETALSKATKA